MQIYKAYYNSPLGMAEITSNDTAILSINIVDHEPTKKGDPLTVEKQMENKKSFQSCPVLKKCVQELDEYFRGQRKNFSIKFGRRGTAFQNQVWSALDKIPFGKTVSYGYIAQEIGRPKAVRAVGMTIGKNPHWVMAPCHRVIGKNGKLTGYAGGIWRKKWLLDHEGVEAASYDS